MVTVTVMPEMSGADLAWRIEAEYPEIRVLIMSGYTRDSVTRRSIVCEQSAFIQKPFTADDLAVKVREVLEAHQPRCERRRPFGTSKQSDQSRDVVAVFERAK